MEKEGLSFKATEADRGKRLDKFLVDELSERFSRVFIQKLITGGDVKLNGLAVKCHHKLNAGDSVEVKIPEAKPFYMTAEEIPLEIVYEDEHLLVVNKPQEMVVHPAPGNYTGTLANALMAHCKDLSGIGGVAKPGIVHRLDKGTSGLLVAAKTDETHRALSKQFKNKTTTRIYAALVKGIVQLDNGIIELPVGRSSYDRRKMAVKFDDDAKEAKTQYKVIKRFKRHTLLELKLGTGRTHQIRVHMAYIGHPLVGDEKYGHKGLLSHPALHAKTLGFIHPVTKKYMEFTSKLPDDMNELISKGDL